MRISETPPFIYRKLLELAELDDEIVREREGWRRQLEQVTAVVRNKRVPTDVLDINQQGFDYQAYLDEFTELRAKLAAPVGKGTPGETHRRLRRWVEELPDGTVLEQLEAKVPDDVTSLADAQRRIAKRRGVINEIRRLPHPSADIEERLRQYVADIGTVNISGVEEGERLEASWGKEPMTGQPKEPTPLQVAALAHPEELVQGLLRQVRRAALGSCPPSERPGRIRELEREIEQLERIEEVLVLAELAAGRPVERRSDASAAAILQVKVVEKPAVETKKARVA